jgi:hypothetical protein
MAFLSNDRRGHSAVAALARARILPNAYDVVAFAFVAGLAVLALHGAAGMRSPLAGLATAPVSLDPALLPEYALRTTLRMFAAIIASLVFTFVVATLAAKSRRAEMIIIPALDILQSVPVLGFLTFTVTFFMGLFPGSQLVRRSSRFSPPRPGTWPFPSTSRSGPCRRTSTKSAGGFDSRPGSGSGGSRRPSPRPGSSGTR